jgi:hypothetical protein
VRNEQFLAQCLKDVRAVVDEIAVVDMSAIRPPHRGRFRCWVSFPWIDDSARPATIRWNCHGQLILVLMRMK